MTSPKKDAKKILACPNTEPPNSLAYVWFLENCFMESDDSAHKLKDKLTSPLIFAPQFPVSKVSCGVSIAAFLTTNGQVFTWSFKQGLCKDGLECPKLLHASNERRVKAIACGNHHLCCLCDNSDVLTTGCFHHGQLGANLFDSLCQDTQSDSTRSSVCYCGVNLSASKEQLIKDVFLLTFNTPVASIACGPRQTFAVTLTGVVWGMGEGVAGWEAYSKDATNHVPIDLIYTSPRLIQLSPLSHPVPVSQVACGEGFFLALTQEGAVISWGRNETGSLGRGKRSHHGWPQPVMFTPFSRQPNLCKDNTIKKPINSLSITSLHAGSFSVAKTSTGSLWLWGIFQWLSPHCMWDGDLEKQSDAPLQNSTCLCMTSKELLTLNRQGVLTVTLLRLPIHTLFLRANSSQGFTSLNCSQKICVAMGPVSDSLPLKVFLETEQETQQDHADSTTDSPPSFGETPRDSDLLGAEECEDLHKTNKKDVLQYETLCSTNCSTASESDQRFNGTQSPTRPEFCSFCSVKSQKYDQLKEKLERFQLEFDQVLNQYQSDLLALSEGFNKKKKIREQFDEQLLQILQNSREDNTAAWTEKIQQIIDRFSMNAKDPLLIQGCTPMLILIQRYVQKHKYFENKVQLCEDKITEIQESEARYIEKLNDTLQHLAEKDKALVTSEEKKCIMERESKEYERKIEELKGSVEEMRLSKFQEDDRLFELRTNLQKAYSELEIVENDNRRLKSDLERLTAKCGHDQMLQAKLESSEGSRLRLKSRLNDLESQLTDLKTHLNNLEAENTRLNLTLVSKQYDLQSLDLEKKSLVATNQRLAQENKALDADRLRLSDSLVQAEQSLKEKQNDEKLQKDVSETEKIREELKKQEMCEKKLSRLLHELQNENERLRCNMNSLVREQNQKLKEMRERSSLADQKMWNDFKNEKHKSQKLEEQINHLRAEMNICNQQLDRQKQHYSALVMTLQSHKLLSKEKYSMDAASVDSLVEEVLLTEADHTKPNYDIIQLLNIRMKEIEQEYTARETVLEESRKRIEELEKINQAHSHLINKSCSECQQLKVKVKALEKEVLEKHQFVEQVEHTVNFLETPHLENQLKEYTTVCFDHQHMLSTSFEQPVEQSSPEHRRNCANQTLNTQEDSSQEKKVDSSPFESERLVQNSQSGSDHNESTMSIVEENSSDIHAPRNGVSLQLPRNSICPLPKQLQSILVTLPQCNEQPLCTEQLIYKAHPLGLTKKDDHMVNATFPVSPYRKPPTAMQAAIQSQSFPHRFQRGNFVIK